MNKFLFVVVFLLLTNQYYSSAATNISGQIRNNTTWTKAGSPYICNGLIEVAPNVTLTIEPGVKVELDLGLNIYGFLYLNATSNDSIHIYAKNQQSNNVTYIKFDDSALLNATIDTYYIKYCRFSRIQLWFEDHAMSLEVSHSNFDANYGGITWAGRDGTTFSVHDNYISSWIFCGYSSKWPRLDKIEIYNNVFNKCYSSPALYLQFYCDSTYIRNNIFTNTPRCIQFRAVTTADISNNVFSGNEIGIDAITSSDVEYHITENVFTNNKKALRFGSNAHGNAYMKHNSIYNNEYGIGVNEAGNVPLYNETKLFLDSNCIQNNKIAGLYWVAKNDYSIGANWWGTTDTNIIDSAIFDNKDDFKTGKISYQPFLTLTSPNCKTYTPPTNVGEIHVQKSGLAVYPNPITNKIMLTSEIPIKEVSLYDIMGKLLHIAHYNSKDIIINTSEFSAGLYMYKIVTEDSHIQTGKVIKR